mmetsp:Transcript_37060/g.47891  ORF Transcript_37060/g.47891 Transcript_37060/m.47891 type:complete len:376 (-) Transcript_37060:132-1259(-)
MAPSNEFVGMKGGKVNFHENDFNYEDFIENIKKEKDKLAPMLDDKEASQVLENATKDGVAWNNFYKRETNPYKPRRYLSVEFPQLLAGQSFLFKLLPRWLQRYKCVQYLTFCKDKFLFDVGSGYGSALFPLMRANPCLSVLACDLSENAISQLIANPLFDSNRVKAHPWDITKGMPPLVDKSSMKHGQVDLVILVFTLSAIDPKLHVEVLRNLGDSLSLDGVICFRDRALYDLTMMRSKQRLADATFAREDGTLAHYFTTEEFTRTVDLAGLEFLELPKYCTVSMKNRQKGTTMNRCFIHATLRRKKPKLSSSTSSSSSSSVAATAPNELDITNHNSVEESTLFSRNNHRVQSITLSVGLVFSLLYFRHCNCNKK